MNESPVSEPETDQGAQNPEPVSVVSLLLLRHRALREGFLDQIQQAGGPAAWLSSRCPRSALSLSTITTDPSKLQSIVVSETQAFWTGHEARLGECARCPKDGAACADSRERLPEGILTRLALLGDGVTEELRGCGRYAGFRLAERLERSGVDKRLCRVKLQELSELPLPQVILAFDDFIGSGQGSSAPRMRQILLQGDRSREYAVALLRSAMKNFPGASYRSVNAPSLVRLAMNAMTVKEESPFLDLVAIDVLLLDSIEPDLLKPSYARKEIVWLYERRRDQGLATIITTTGQVKEAFAGVSVLKV